MWAGSLSLGRSPSEARATVAEECHECSDTDDGSQRKASVEGPVAEKGRNGDIYVHFVFICSP